MQYSAIDINNNVRPMSTKYPEITLYLQYDDKNEFICEGQKNK